MLQIDPLKTLFALAVSVAAIGAASCTSFSGGAPSPDDAGAREDASDGAAADGDALGAPEAGAEGGPISGTDCTDTTTVDIGNGAESAATDPTGGRTFDAYPFVAPTTASPATVRCAHVYIAAIDEAKGAKAGDAFELGIYDDVDGKPSALLAKAELTLPNPPALASAPFASPLPIVAGHTYWLAVGGVPSFSVQVINAGCKKDAIPDGPSVSELPSTFPNENGEPLCNLRAFAN